VPVNSTSSLAVFYVEQVALNRHVMPNYGTSYLEAGGEGCQGEFVGRNVGSDEAIPQGLKPCVWELRENIGPKGPSPDAFANWRPKSREPQDPQATRRVGHPLLDKLGNLE
jgi:hypothetical protein